MTHEDMRPDELMRKGIRILVRELGIADATRFIRQLKPGSGDYTRERDDLFGDMTVEQIVQEIRAQPKALEK